MDSTNNAVSNEAVDYVKKHAKELISKFVGNVESVTQPISIFMAGSPGAGKTEFSTRLIDSILGAEDKIVRIDPDQVRLWLPQYQKGKAELVQSAVTVAVNKIHDYVIDKSKSFLLDGTFSRPDIARLNVQRSLNKNRPVLIQYVIQPPEVAWKFTQDREQVDGRNIRKEDFIREFIAARDTVATIQGEFGERVTVDLIERNLHTQEYEVSLNLENLDKYLPRKYSEDELTHLL